jgi:hypothetical protein
MTHKMTQECKGDNIVEENGKKVCSDSRKQECKYYKEKLCKKPDIERDKCN